MQNSAWRKSILFGLVNNSSTRSVLLFYDCVYANVMPILLRMSSINGITSLWTKNCGWIGVWVLEVEWLARVGRWASWSVGEEMVWWYRVPSVNYPRFPSQPRQITENIIWVHWMVLGAARSSAWPPINRGRFDCATVLQTVSAKDPHEFVRLVAISTF